MLAPHASSGSLVLALVLCAACGGAKPPPLAADTPSSDPPDSSASETPPPPPAADTPSIVACVASELVCAETAVSEAEGADAKERCKAAQGEPHDGECTHDNIAGTCAVESKKLTLYYYKGKNAKTTRGLLKTAATSCANLTGTFTATKAAGGGGGGKKKPKGK